MRRAPVWLFDLDNTLHDARVHIFPHINQGMTRYIETHLALSTDAADALRREYWLRYGATLLGLIRHHRTDPRHFLWHTHQFPALERMVVSEAGLLHALRRLPGRRIVFSNAPLHYAEAVLEILGLEGFFDALYTIERIDFRPKPSIAGFRALLAAERLDPRECIMVEDTARNLRTAKQLGMKTVLVARDVRIPAYVDLRITAIRELVRRFPRLLASAHPNLPFR